MRLVVQRASEAFVVVDGEVVGAIRQGFLVLVAMADTDALSHIYWAADKVAGLRIFSDSEGKLRWGLRDVGGSVLVVSQFTLYGDVSRGLRPNFSRAAPAEDAELFYQAFVNRLRTHELAVETGVFGAHMAVRLVNDGPVTLFFDTDEVMGSGF